MLSSSTSALQHKGLKRNIIDKFYTKSDVASSCITLIKQNVSMNETDLIVEPSAGNGVFIDGIKLLSKHHLFYDLEPENADIIKQDYLTYDHREIKKRFVKIHVVGNPPFGRQSSLAIKFIRKSCEFCNSISFILPKSFKKESLKNKFPLQFHLVYECDLPDNSFLVDGSEHNVPCVFQIWEKKETNRSVAEKIEPLHFEFVDKKQHPDISFRRVGVNAGTMDVNIDEKSIQSHYFIKFTNNKTLHDNLNKLSKINFEFNNTVGPNSISKQELIRKFNQILEC
jgi:predicted RNA methylase